MKSPQRCGGPGQIVTVSGEGFYSNTGVRVDMCPAESVVWGDSFDCIARPNALGYAVTDDTGAFSLEVELPRKFSTWRDTEIDCRIDDCVVRVDPNAGVPRFGWAGITFE